MKKYNVYVIGIALLSSWALPSFSQVSNDNEDEVNKVDSRFAAQDYVPGQVLVKFKDANRVTVRRSQGRFASTSIDRVTAILHKYGTDEMEQLLPNQNPNRQMRRAKAYSGEFIQERDLSQLYCLKLSEEHQQETEMMVGELNALDEVEYAEPIEGVGKVFHGDFRAPKPEQAGVHRGIAEQRRQSADHQGDRDQRRPSARILPLFALLACHYALTVMES